MRSFNISQCAISATPCPLIYAQHFCAFRNVLACYDKIAEIRASAGERNDFLEREPGMAPAVRFNLDTPITHGVHITSRSHSIASNLYEPLCLPTIRKPQLKFKKNSRKPVSRPSEIFRCGVVTQERQSRMISFNYPSC